MAIVTIECVVLSNASGITASHGVYRRQLSICDIAATDFHTLASAHTGVTGASLGTSWANRVYGHAPYHVLASNGYLHRGGELQIHANFSNAFASGARKGVIDLTGCPLRTALECLVPNGI